MRGTSAKAKAGTHPAGTRGADHAARAQDVRKEPAGAAQRAGERIGDRTEDEAPRRQFGQIGDHRRSHIAEAKLAGLHEITDGILGEVESANQRPTDIPADVARFGGVIGQRGGYGTLAGREHQRQLRPQRPERRPRLQQRPP